MLLLLLDFQTVEFRLETNEAIPAELSLAITAEIVRLAKLKSAFGRDTPIEIVEIGRGSLVIRLNIAAAIATIASFALMLEDRVRSNSGRLPELVAEACVDHGATECRFKGGDVEFSITRHEMPAVQQYMDVPGESFQEKRSNLLRPEENQIPKRTVGVAPAELRVAGGEAHFSRRPRQAFVGSFVHQGVEPVFVNARDERTFVPKGKIDWETINFGNQYVVIGRLVEGAEPALRILEVEEYFEGTG
ncbi:hypothetical protein [Alteriqipengyuania lutimaris]|uniref:Uncharacterized protein n=1 Tax=Alteriqipengyuania lutimaris TaxID=1538146 RepID=A0A395LJ79_9SPHN|nr:hypothetical protein [Alteriqipengyuania lutimaris]MBB3034037.1 hypothetical protein [Alteriqipengyuania lutimaris]RDS77018.1 hypothetical protein DL238_04935 [Alteriqipengyuania lutimaris]